MTTATALDIRRLPVLSKRAIDSAQLPKLYMVALAEVMEQLDIIEAAMPKAK